MFFLIIIWTQIPQCMALARVKVSINLHSSINFATSYCVLATIQGKFRKGIAKNWSLIIVVRLTVATSFSIKEEMILLDMNGNIKFISPATVHVMLAVGWGTFIVSWIVNIIYYLLHPLAIDIDLGRFMQRLNFNFLGWRIGILIFLIFKKISFHV